MDFHVTGGLGVEDVVTLRGDYTLRQQGDKAIVDLGHGDMLVLKGIDMDDLTPDNFYQY